MPDSTYTQAPAIQTASDTLPLHQWLAAPCDTAQQSVSQACHLLQLRPGNQVTPVVCFQSLSDIHTPFFSLQEVPLPQAEGETGTPLPYSFCNDDYLTGMLLLCFFLVAWSISSSWHYFRLHFKALFRPAGLLLKSNAENADTTLRGSAFLLLQAGFSFGILYYDYLAQNHWALVDTIGNPHLIMALSGSMIVVFVLLKVGLYQMVNRVFFPKNSRDEWRETYVFTIVLMGLLILPVSLLVFFFDLSFEKQFVAFICIVCIAKLILLYRCSRTFFGHVGSGLHLILYLCALEIVPALILWRVLFWANTNLSIL